MIGNFDEINCKWGLFPTCLRAGTNPASFNSGTVPVYRGPSSGGAEVATLTNMATGYGYVATTGVINFDGSNDNVAITGHTCNYTNASQQTYAIHAFFDGSSAGTVYGEYTDANNQMIIFFAGDGKIVFRYIVGGVTRNVKASVPTGLVYGWNTVVCVKDGGTLKVYCRGTEASYFGAQDPYDLGDISFSQAYLGLGQGFYFNGCLSWVTVFDDAISTDRITSLTDNATDFYGLLATDNGDDTATLAVQQYASADDVRDGVDRGDGTNGNLVVPSVNDVQESVTFDSSSSSTGVLGLPTEAQVESGVGFGANDTEFTGSYSPDFPDVANVLTSDTTDGVQGRWTAATADIVQSGETFGVDGTSITGTYQNDNTYPTTTSLESMESVVSAILRGDATLAALVGTYSSAPSMFSDQAPENLTGAYIVFGITRIPTGPRNLGVFNLMVDYFDRGTSRADARSAIQRIEEILDLKTFSGASWDTIRFSYESGGHVPTSPDPRDIHYNIQFSIRAGRKAFAATL